MLCRGDKRRRSRLSCLIFKAKRLEVFSRAGNIEFRRGLILGGSLKRSAQRPA
jgi:hypothetical protein